MTRLAEELKLTLGQLPNEDRAELAHFLIGSLDEATDQDTEAYWDEELARRSVEIRKDQVKGKKSEHLFARLRGWKFNAS